MSSEQTRPTGDASVASSEEQLVNTPDQSAIHQSDESASSKVHFGLLLQFFVAGALLIWAYWPACLLMADRWARDPQYSHGFLVPLIAFVLLWMRRETLDASKWKPSWWGLLVLAGALGLRLVGTFYYFEYLTLISFVPAVMGVVLLLGGWEAFRWSWSAVAFLAFMVPLPHTLEAALRDPLRRIGTLSSTYLMQTCGLPAISEGNVIIMENVRIGVVEACSGLRMLMIFFALSTAFAMIAVKRWWERLIIVASAVPISLISNILRITVTGALHYLVNKEWADAVFHDLAGWLMMPLALLLLWVELKILSNLIIEEEVKPMSAGL
ncbi:exosortase/archaeosortase family protein [Calycomorphotria hydatis]|uniref:Transmembrane exosortase (Exosortase_EpsH) n=1 Tax=Calycomorphotria hydatis TaxID=2528027 RepID=A0A517T4J1_9PLAN|nr:exosortase/archaeosortase family protein [Calycomorphotria hydatis]QDT63306.1 Transmembrane exosortase (Exosortase_EpsH) [Calycomorphotria hydatis]